MATTEITLIALQIRKWDTESQKITLNSFFLLEDGEKNITFDVSILQPPEMVEEFLGKLRYEAEKKLREENGDGTITVGFDNETFLRQKIYNYFKRISMELNNPRRKKGQSKMILTTHMDLYNENQDISFLPARFQFYVTLNWVRKYYEKEDYKKAIEPLRKLVKAAPDYGLGYKWLARSLKKIRKYDEAMRTYEKYAEVDNSLDAWLDLAKSYRKGKIFDKSEEIYHKLLADDPGNKEAKIGLAQIYYANKDDKYLEVFDKLNEEDSAWFKEWLIDEFNFRIYISEKTLLSPNQAAKFLGFKQIFELTQRAFKNDIPSHFNPSKARMSFFKEELENWAMVMNRYNCLPEKVELYPDRINHADDPVQEGSIGENSGEEIKQTSAGRQLTRVEEILMQIRARKAQRVMEQTNGDSNSDSKGVEQAAAEVNNNEKKTKSAKKPKKTAKTKSSGASGSIEDEAKPVTKAKRKPAKKNTKASDAASPDEAKTAAKKKTTSRKKVEN